MTLRDVESLHRWELMRTSCIGDLKSADVFVAADDLSICIFYRRNIGILERICPHIDISVKEQKHRGKKSLH